MPSKRELLEELTVGELKQMARNKKLSGYSTMRKADLVDMIESNYTKAEIESWPESTPKEVKLGELELEGKIEEWPPSARVTRETPREAAEEETFKRILQGTIIGLIIVIVIIVVWSIL